MSSHDEVVIPGDRTTPQFVDLPADFLAWQHVSIFVGTGSSDSLIARPANIDDCRQVLTFCQKNALNVCPRGSARSYGDAILNDRNVILDMRGFNEIGEISESGTITVGPGTRLVDVFQKIHHLEWTIPASPTDSTISVGGALGANVNGKDSWRVGNFGDQVLGLKVLTAAGEVLDIDRENNRELFMGVIGGMGLLALVVEVTLMLQRAPSPYLDMEITPADNLDDLLDKLAATRKEADFIVVWIDAYAKKEKLGRAVIHASRWADSNESPEKIRADIDKSVRLLARQKQRAVTFYNAFRPMINLGFHFQKIVFWSFNRFYYWLNSRPKAAATNKAPEMFLEHNFDKSYTVPPPDILCGPHGFTVQISIPEASARDAITEMLQLCQSLPCPPATTILRLHRRDDHVISFSEDGYSLNVEFHPKKRHARKMSAFMHAFIECGIRHGSRVHLPKDISLSSDQFRQLFPRAEEFLELKNAWDPGALFQSDMYRRLFAPNKKTDSGAGPH